MESNQRPCILKTGGNPGADCTLLVSDLFTLLPGSFDNVIPHFQPRYRTAVYEDNGLDANYSTDLRHSSIQGYANDLVHCLVENGLSNITYLAHSINALLAFTAASKAPHLFDKIILLNAFPCLQTDPQNLCSYEFAGSNINDAFACCMLRHRSFADEPAKESSSIQLMDILAKQFSRMEAETAKAILKVLLQADCREVLPDFQIPTVILQTAGDKFSTSETSFFMHRNIPDSRIIKIKAKGHLPQAQAPEEIIKAIEFFTYMPVY